MIKSGEEGEDDEKERSKKKGETRKRTHCCAFFAAAFASEVAAEDTETETEAAVGFEQLSFLEGGPEDGSLGSIGGEPNAGKGEAGADCF